MIWAITGCHVWRKCVWKINSLPATVVACALHIERKNSPHSLHVAHWLQNLPKHRHGSGAIETFTVNSTFLITYNKKYWCWCESIFASVIPNFKPAQCFFFLLLTSVVPRTGLYWPLQFVHVFILSPWQTRVSDKKTTHTYCSLWTGWLNKIMHDSSKFKEQTLRGIYGDMRHQKSISWITEWTLQLIF